MNQQKTGESKKGSEDVKRRLEFAAEDGNSEAEAEPGSPQQVKKGKGYVAKTSAEIDTLQHVVFPTPAKEHGSAHFFGGPKKPHKSLPGKSSARAGHGDGIFILSAVLLPPGCAALLESDGG